MDEELNVELVDDEVASLPQQDEGLEHNEAQADQQECVRGRAYKLVLESEKLFTYINFYVMRAFCYNVNK